MPVHGPDNGDVVDGGQNGEDHDGASQGPPASPRPDGAVLLFSAYGPGRPNASAQNVAFSPDGTLIVFTLFENGYNEGPARLCVANADGSDAHYITPEEDQDNVNVPGAAWNEVTDEIVFASDRQGSDDIWAIRPDGSGLRRVTDHDPAAQDHPPYWIEPVWSPDGQWVVFEADIQAASETDQRGTIYKVRSDGTELTQLTRRLGEDVDDRLPNWSPDGEYILFQRRLPHDQATDGDNWDIYVIDTDGDGLLNVSNAGNKFNTDNSWSPGGDWIASSSAYQESGDVLPHPNIIAFFVPRTGDGPTASPLRITFSDVHEDGAPSVSPDSQWVAFESHRSPDEQSPSDLWIIETPGALRP
ncbi:MAG: TolB family protein [Phycisphaerae bacterium]